MHAWAGQAGGAVGESMPVEALWRLAQLWFEGRMAPAWTPRSTAESQALLAAAGFVGPFWSITGTDSQS